MGDLLPTEEDRFGIPEGRGMPEGPGMLEGGGRRERGGLLSESTCGWGRGADIKINILSLTLSRNEKGTGSISRVDVGRDIVIDRPVLGSVSQTIHDFQGT